MTREADENVRIGRLIALDKSRLPADGGPDFNRLIFASSPYLLQHADNPVAWYEWGEDPFARAKAEDKPVFLSIGYATCHWCHVMAHECFADPEVAGILNRGYIAIKVDREERPDLDEQYMAVSQMMTGSGGWPLNLFLTPERQPFLAVTYVPKYPKMGMPGFMELLENVTRVWQGRRDLIDNNCASVMDSLRRLSRVDPGGLPEPTRGAEAQSQLEAMYDHEYGGFGRAPKFPMPVYLSYLLRAGGDNGVRLACRSLLAMRHGGICDQAGFGFHRYAVDQRWLIPHFEKMLYDQALIATAALEAGQASGDGCFIEIAEEIFTFVLRDLTSPEGGFHSALDADSEGEEGAFYLWTPAEIRDVLGATQGERCCRVFGVTGEGNFEGRNILSLSDTPVGLAEREGVAPELFLSDLARWREALLDVRQRRIRPLRDEKILTSWNGLMIAALARGYAVTGERRWLEAAGRGAAFVRSRLVAPSGRLMRCHHQGRAGVPAFLEDYAFLAWGLLELYDATLGRDWLDWASSLAVDMLGLFRDEDSGVLHGTGSDGEALLVRQLSAHDGAIPSGYSVAVRALVRLGAITGEERFSGAADAALRAISAKMAAQPAGYLYGLLAAEELAGDQVAITFSGKLDEGAIDAMLKEIGRRLIPNLILKRENPDGGPGIVSVCAAGACRPPVGDPRELAQQLEQFTRRSGSWR